ncbi:unnamed protein product [Symbiodinium natans]|uniref:Uncharacterized protein n=1 Tax=Symbiodinium natans TaxID=878477 RepID=A0A812LGJ6_9DINO|nr:unnamed protein product [Symbiodinium natans]
MVAELLVGSQGSADYEEVALEQGQEQPQACETRAAPALNLSYLEGLALQGGSQQNLAAIPEAREFVGGERSLWTRLEPRNKASVNYRRAQQARDAVFKGTPFAQRFLEDRPGKQARASFARDEEAPTLSHAPTTEFESVAPTHPATSVYYSSDEEVEVQVEEEPESSDTSRATATSAGSSSWYNSRAGSDIWRRDETRRNEQWERYQPYHSNGLQPQVAAW